MPQMGPNQWIFMSNMMLALLIIPTVSNFVQSLKHHTSPKKEQTKKDWKW